MRCVCLSIIMLFLGVLNTLYAQNFKVFDIKRIDTYTDSSFCNKPDNNGIPCAVIKVVTQERGIEFENTYLVDVEEFDGGYIVYMASGAKRIKIKHPNYLSINVDYSSFDIPYLESETQYELTLKCDNHNEEDIGKAIGLIKDTLDMLYSNNILLNDNEMSAPVRMALKGAAINNDYKAKIFLASFCRQDNPKLSSDLISSILEEGDSTCLEEIDCDLLLLYANSIPSKDLEKHVKEKKQENERLKKQFPDYYNEKVTGDLSIVKLLDQYERAMCLQLKAYEKGCTNAKNDYNKIQSAINELIQDTYWQDFPNENIVRLLARLGFPEAKKQLSNIHNQIEELIK